MHERLYLEWVYEDASSTFTLYGSKDKTDREQPELARILFALFVFFAVKKTP